MLSQTHSPVGRPRLGPFAAGTVTAIDDDGDPTRDRTFAYDALDRLTQSTGAYGTLDYTYDSAGNRLSRTITDGGTTTETYTVAAASNRLLAVDDGGPTRMLTYADDGSVTTDSRGAGFQYLHNDAGRLVTVKDNGVTAATYTHNALGQRVIKTAGAATTHYHYDRDGRLIAETDGTGAVQREYIHLDGLPLALITGGALYHVHPDHLATPQKMTDGAQQVVWDAQLRPFGEVHAIAGTAANPQRFPGQLFDAETGFHHNYFRDYDPSTGRYLQSDPIGLEGGLRAYVYAVGRPVIHTGLRRLPPVPG